MPRPGSARPIGAGEDDREAPDGRTEGHARRVLQTGVTLESGSQRPEGRRRPEGAPAAVGGRASGGR